MTNLIIKSVGGGSNTLVKSSGGQNIHKSNIPVYINPFSVRYLGGEYRDTASISYISTSSIQPESGTLVLVGVTTRRVTTPVPFVTVSGLNHGWIDVGNYSQNRNVGDPANRLQVFRATITGSTTGTLSFYWNGVTIDSIMWQAIQISGVDASNSGSNIISEVSRFEADQGSGSWAHFLKPNDGAIVFSMDQSSITNHIYTGGTGSTRIAFNGAVPPGQISGAVDYYSESNTTVVDVGHGTGIGNSSMVAVGLLRPNYPYTVYPKQAYDFMQSIAFNVHFGYTDMPYVLQFDSAKSRLLEIGVKYVRDTATFISDSTWMFNYYNRLSQLYNSGGIKISMITTIHDSTLGDKKKYFETIYSRASHSIDSWEGLNEPDAFIGGATWQVTTSYHQEVLWNMAQVPPYNKPVYAPSPVGVASIAALGNISRYFHYGDIHPYGVTPLLFVNEGRHPRTTPDYIFRVREYFSNKPIVVTEQGFPTSLSSSSPYTPTSESVQSKMIIRSYLNNFRMGVRRTYMYEFMDEGSSMDDPETCFGVVRSDGSIKPAFTTIKNTLTILNDSSASFIPKPISYRISGLSPSGTYWNVLDVLLQKSNEQYYLGLWYETASLGNGQDTTQSINLSFNGRNFSQVNLYRPSLGSASISSYVNVTTMSLNVPDDLFILEMIT